MLAVDTVDMIDRLAHRNGLSRSRQIQFAVQAFLREQLLIVAWICTSCGTSTTKQSRQCVGCGTPRE